MWPDKREAGARTDAERARASRNGYMGATRQSLREVAMVLRKQRDLIDVAALNARNEIQRYCRN